MLIATILQEKGNAVAEVSPESRVGTIIDVLEGKRIGSVLVTENDSVIGVVSERDIIHALADHGAESLKMTAREVMTAPVVAISSEESVADAMVRMTEQRVRHLPVIDSGRLIGLVSIGDLVKYRILAAEREAMTLKNYIIAG